MRSLLLLLLSCAVLLGCAGSTQLSEPNSSLDGLYLARFNDGSEEVSLQIGLKTTDQSLRGGVRVRSRGGQFHKASAPIQNVTFRNGAWRWQENFGGSFGTWTFEATENAGGLIVKVDAGEGIKTANAKRVGDFGATLASRSPGHPMVGKYRISSTVFVDFRLFLLDLTPSADYGDTEIHAAAYGHPGFAGDEDKWYMLSGSGTASYGQEGLTSMHLSNEDPNDYLTLEGPADLEGSSANTLTEGGGAGIRVTAPIMGGSVTTNWPANSATGFIPGLNYYSQGDTLNINALTTGAPAPGGGGLMRIEVADTVVTGVGGDTADPFPADRYFWIGDSLYIWLEPGDFSPYNTAPYTNYAYVLLHGTPGGSAPTVPYVLDWDAF